MTSIASKTKGYLKSWEGVDAKKALPSTMIKQDDHVRITGKWVTDKGYPTPTHPAWNEIHPAEKVEILPK
ncbi:MAG TPA: hypothetical protein VKA95_03865 [Nitrososphaeraceae archaeon]|nr:hypothetical protein [Nitrososphaeraceae archaeon]